MIRVSNSAFADIGGKIFRMSQHGGDVYRNHVNIDFSVNLNPLGVPQIVRDTIRQAVEICDRYPDIEAERLKKAVSGLWQVPEDYLLFGNGASELFMAVIHGVRPEKTVIPVPSFYGYEHAARAVEGEIVYYQMREEDGFCITEDLYMVLTEDVDILFLANPNNPTGNLLDKEALERLLQHCQDRDIYVVLDECFMDFSGNQFSMLSEIGQSDHLILIRAFTKIFAIPGVRLGYLICSNRSILAQIAGQLPEWNLSCFAQEAGCICATQTDFVTETVEYVRKERRFLEEGLLKKGLRVFPSAANFILVYSEKPLYEQLLEKGILVRDCGNFRGLGQGFYRIAVKSRRENAVLLDAIGGL